MVKRFSNFRKPKIVLFPLFSMLIFMIITSLIPASAESCECVIFRLVDIQDFYVNLPRIAAMDTFINENEKVSLSIILNGTGLDDDIVGNVTKGLQSDNFELTLHGFNHENFITFNATEQKNLMELSQAKMQSLWGVNSTSFVPPMHQYNDDTLQVMKDLDISIISSGPQGIDPPENIKFIANSTSNITDGFGNYHLPQTAEFYDHGTEPHTKIQHDNIMAAVNLAVSKYGYSVLNLYGTDFAQRNSTGHIQNITNSTEINDLLAIINAINATGYTITTFEETIQFASPPTTANLTVIKNVVNDDSGVNDPGDFMMVITGANPSDNNFAGSISPGTTVTIDPGVYSVDETGSGGYGKTLSSECSGTAVAEESYTCTITNNDDGFCNIPGSGDWTITENCILVTSSSASANVIVQNNSILTISSGVSLDIDFSQFNLTVEFGSGALIKSGGAIT